MFTTIDKALAGLIGAVLTILPMWLPALQFLADPTTQATITGALVPLLVWLVPNKAA